MFPATQRKIRGTVHKQTPNTQPTKEKPLQTALGLLEKHFPEDVTGDMVLEHSGISRGSLYHHFIDVSDLIEQSLVRMFGERVDENIEACSAVMNICRSPDQLYELLCNMTDVTQSSKNRRHRFARARLIGFAEGNDRLVERLGVEQKRLTDGLATLFANAQEQGWITKTVDPHTAALFVQAYTFGRVIDDISVDHVDQKDWNDLLRRAIKMVFF